MGIIFVAMVAGGYLQSGDNMPEWIPLTCYSAIALGTMSGGWKIVKTMGTKITKVNALEGVGAETAGAITLGIRSEEHTSELQSLMRISYAVFCLKKKKKEN